MSNRNNRPECDTSKRNSKLKRRNWRKERKTKRVEEGREAEKPVSRSRRVNSKGSRRSWTQWKERWNKEDSECTELLKEIEDAFECLQNQTHNKSTVLLKIEEKFIEPKRDRRCWTRTIQAYGSWEEDLKYFVRTCIRKRIEKRKPEETWSKRFAWTRWSIRNKKRKKRGKSSKFKIYKPGTCDRETELIKKKEIKKSIIDKKLSERVRKR